MDRCGPRFSFDSPIHRTHIFVRTSFSVVACQLANQGFNAFVNYTNRNAMSDEPDDTKVIKQAFVFATAASCAAALGFKKLFSGRGTLFAVNSTFLMYHFLFSILKKKTPKRYLKVIPVFQHINDSCLNFIKFKISGFFKVFNLVNTAFNGANGS